MYGMKTDACWISHHKVLQCIFSQTESYMAVLAGIVGKKNTWIHRSAHFMQMIEFAQGAQCRSSLMRFIDSIFSRLCYITQKRFVFIVEPLHAINLDAIKCRNVIKSEIERWFRSAYTLFHSSHHFLFFFFFFLLCFVSHIFFNGLEHLRLTWELFDSYEICIHETHYTCKVA